MPDAIPDLTKEEAVRLECLRMVMSWPRDCQQPLKDADAMARFVLTGASDGSVSPPK